MFEKDKRHNKNLYVIGSVFSFLLIKCAISYTQEQPRSKTKCISRPVFFITIIMNHSKQ